MLYRPFGATGKSLSAIGFGTNRFSSADLTSMEGLSRAAEVLCYGIRAGINYIDCGHTYAMGRAEEIVRIALGRMHAEGFRCYTSAKTMFLEDPSAEKARKRIANSLVNMGVGQAEFGFLWKISSYDEFLKASEPGKTLDGLLKAKEEGMIEHLCLSSHASVAETIKILESNLFSGCIVSCSILNVRNYAELFAFSRSRNIGVMTMNSLGGGTVPKLGKLLWGECDREMGCTAAQKALLSLYENQEITSMLSSMESIKQVEENVAPFRTGALCEKCSHLKFSVPTGTAHLCTKCRYCAGCPVGIPIADMMYAYTNRVFTDLMHGYGDRELWAAGDDDLMVTKQIFNPRFCDLNAIPQTAENPCIKCGRCEKLCTQKLSVMSAIDEIYRRSRAAGFSHEQRRERLEAILNAPGYRRVGFFPAGKYTTNVIEAYLQYFGEMQFELLIFDNDPKVWGSKQTETVKVFSPEEIPKWKPELLLITNYRFGEEIFRQLKENAVIGAMNIHIEKLHKDEDIAWF